MESLTKAIFELYLRLLPFQGRHSLRVNVPTDFPVVVPLSTLNLTANGTSHYVVRFAARSSPSGVRISAQLNPGGSHPTAALPPIPPNPARLGIEWAELEVSVVAIAGEECLLTLWMQSDLHTGASVWVDVISVLSDNPTR